MSSSANQEHKEIKKEPANLFTRARESLNLSQRELAYRLNTSLYAVARWERGDVEPSRNVLARLKAILDPCSLPTKECADRKHELVFASNGIRAKSSYVPTVDHKILNFLEKPKKTILEGLWKNNLWGNSGLALSDIFLDREISAATRCEPLDEEISAGKNTYTYDAHTYHTKVPPQGIAKVIAKYLPDGGVVLDPFAGSGMTGVAARYLGYDVILNELSPAACFIAYNFIRTVDTGEFNSVVAQIMANLSELRKTLYRTECRECGAEVEQLYTVWSYELECNYCGDSFILWEHCRKYGNNVREHKLLRKFPCPNCGEELNKSYLKRLKSIPVFLGYRCCSKRIVEHPLMEKDLEVIEDAERLLSSYSSHFPTQNLPDGVNLNQPKRHGLTSIDKFYTNRNLVACAAIWHEIKRIEDPELAAAIGFVFTSLYQRVTRFSEYRFWGGSGNTANFNVPHISNEPNVFVTFERKAKSIADHFYTTAQNYSGLSVIRTGSATDLGFLPDNSIDFIFTDPPFGANINYSEMNILWESWLGTFTDATSEAIINKKRGKGLDNYQKLMTESLREIHRVLRPEHWMVMVFMNSSEKVWDALRVAISSAGFTIDKINIFDKQHGTFKQFVSENTAGADLMIHCKKVTPPLEKSVDTSAKRNRIEHSVTNFIQEERCRIPVFPFVHVKRDAEIDYRTLYSRYIVKAMNDGAAIVGFAKFRSQASEILKDGI